jgi:endonuclease YncB( thermonuclease family)
MLPLRDTLLNLAITCVLVLIIVLVAILLKESRPAPLAALPVGVAQVSAGQEASTAPSTLPDFKVFPKAKFIESRTNEADTLRIKVSDSEDEHVFVLYFVDALDASWTHPQRVQEQSRYFGVSGERVVTEGQRAAAYVSQLLKSHAFSVMTRWEQVPERSRFYALILVEISAGKWVYLADLLVQQGFARVAGVTTSLPSDSRSMNDYALELQTLRKQAEQRKAGVWAASKL